MHVRRRRFLVPMLSALVVACSPGVAVAVDTTIGFEDLPDGTAVGAQYSALGVQLDPSADLAVETNELARESDKLLRATDHVCAPGSQVGFNGLLSSPRTTVGIWVRDPFPLDFTAHEVTLQTFDAGNADAGFTSASVNGGSGWQQLLAVADPGKTIDHFRVSVETGICTMVFDDLSFDVPFGGEAPNVTWESVPPDPVAVERGASATTTAALRRRGGSTGRVDLAVSGLPTGVSAVVTPAQANGSDLRSTVSIALTAAADAPVTPNPVTVTLRATPLDGSAGEATPVETTFKVTVPAPFVSLELTAPARDALYRGDATQLPLALVRHSLSSGPVKISVTGPPGVALSASPSTLDGSSSRSPVFVAVTVAPNAPRSPDGSITITATSDDAAAAPPGRPAELKIAAPVRVPEVFVDFPNPASPVLRAGGGTIRVDTRITATDLPPGTIVTSGVRGIPGDVTADASPTSWPASAGSVLFKVNLTTKANAVASSQRPVVWARAEIPGRGALDDGTAFTLTVVPTIRYALAARGIEVTQGIQTDGPGCSSIPTRDFSHIESSVPYKGVRLVDGDLTVARVFVSAFVLTNTNGLGGVDVRLHAYRNGREIAGSPLSPIGKPAVVKIGDVGCVSAADRAGADNVYTYAVPPGWTFGNVTLQAEILPLAPTSTGSVLDECASKFCQTMKRFTLRSVRFNRIRWPGIQPIRITAKGADPGTPEAATYPARMLLPGQPGLWSYQGTEDISDLIDFADAVAKIPLLANALDRRDIVEGGAATRVKAWAAILQGRSIVAGLAGAVNDIAGVANGKHISDLPALPFGARPSLLVTTVRPLTSVAHELTHVVGRRHAGQNCPNTGPGAKQEGDPWPPDDMGYLQGIGLDLWSLTSGSGFVPTVSQPYRVIARGLAGGPAEFYDFMSYCATGQENQALVPAPDSWLSPRGWDETVGWLEAYTKRTGGAVGVAAAVPKAALSVSAVGRGDVAAIISVAPTRTRPLAAGTQGPVLVGYDAAGAEVTRAGLTDEVLDDTDLHTYSGSVAAAGIARVAIVDRAGKQFAERTQSATAPSVVVTAPRAGATVGGARAVRVAWTGSDADGDKLVSTIETSADDGDTWRQIYQGGASAATLPAGYFAASAKARLRITVNDGFRATSVVSGRFRTLRPPATVQIDSPRKGTKLGSDAALSLIGAASTVAGPVASGKLIWRLDGRQVASGKRTSVRNLPPGRRVLSLTVRGDAKAGARVTLVIRPVTPRFLQVTLPRRIGPAARSIAVRLRSGTATTVRAAGKSVRIKARRRGVLRVPIAPGRGEVVLTFTARALGHDYVFTRAVRRG